MNFLTTAVNGRFFFGRGETSFILELTKSRIIGGALSGIMFNGVGPEDVALFKKDAVLPKLFRIHGLEVGVGVPKRRMGITDEVEPPLPGSHRNRS